MTHRYIKVGLIARSDFSGLGYQTKALYDLLTPSKVLLIDSTPFNGREQHYTWYSSPQVSMGFPTDEDLDIFLRDIDVVISCEIFYHDKLVDMARDRGIKTVLQPNPELNPLIYNPTHSKPDALFLPTSWHYEKLSKLCKTYICPPPITVGMDTTPLEKPQGTLRVLHMAGRKAYMDRNGTEIVERLPTTPGVTLTIHDQGKNNIEDPSDIYKDHHVVLLPRRYGGLCLPMRESLALGLPILMPKILPNTDTLPQNWLILPSRRRMFRTKSPVEGVDVSIRDIVPMLERFRDMDNNQYQEERNKAWDIHKEYQERLYTWKTYLEEIVT